MTLKRSRLPYVAYLPSVLVLLSLSLGPVFEKEVGSKRENLAPPGESRSKVCIILAEGFALTDIAEFDVISHLEISTDSPRMAYGLARRYPRAGSGWEIAEILTGTFAGFLTGKDGEILIPEERTIGHALGKKGVEAAYLIPAETQLPEDFQKVAKFVNWSRLSKIEEVPKVWNETGVRFLFLMANSKDHLSAIRSVLLDPGRLRTVFLVGMPQVQSDAKDQMQPVCFILGSGRGIGGRYWPALFNLPDLYSTSLYLLEIPIPASVNGSIIWDLLDISFISHNQPVYDPGA